MDRKCNRCKLGCGKAVPGFGSLAPRLIVFSDYPGKKETESGKPMMGPAGQLLRKSIAHYLGLNPDTEVFYDNVIRCETSDPKAEQITACKYWTNETFKNVQCDIVLIAGARAFETLLPQVFQREQLKDKDFNTSRAHGRVFEHMGKIYFVTWNPAHVAQYTFKDPKTKAMTGRGKYEYKTWAPTGSVTKLFVEDMKRLGQLIQQHEAARAGA